MNNLQFLTGEQIKEAQEYWVNKLSGELNEVSFIKDKEASLEYKNGCMTVGFKEDLAHKLLKFCSNKDTFVFVLMLAALKLQLHKYTGQEDINVGAPVYRYVEEIQRNYSSIPIRTSINDKLSFNELLASVKANVAEGYKNQYFSMEKLAKALNLQNEVPLYKIVLCSEKMHNKEIISEIANSSLYDAVISISYAENSLSLCVNYNTVLFKEGTVKRVLEHYMNIIEQVLAEPGKELAAVSMVSEEGRKRILADFNNTYAPYPTDRLIYQLFEEQVELTPDAVALVFEGEQLTYLELNKRANSLAHFLKDNGVGPDVMVGVCLERSIEMVVSLLGILKAGGVYVPFDPNYPKDRFDFMINNAKIKMLLTAGCLVERITESGASIICLDRLKTEIFKMSTENPVCEVNNQNLAYVIYTSGSTGAPKGAMNTHLGLCNHKLWMQDKYKLTQEDRVLQKTPFSFDVSVWEFFWPLITGARLVVAKPEGHKDPQYLINTIVEQGITVIHFVPSMLYAFLEQPNVNTCTSLRQVFCSGEALGLDLLQFFKATFNIPIHNVYGPAECADVSTAWTCGELRGDTIVTIGKPISNVRVYILDKNMLPVPVGVPGELYIAGLNVGKGYIDNQELTRERFVCPHNNVINEEILYKTGDLGRWIEDGNIEYLGRTDNQVKIRGFRIETGEVEAAIKKRKDIKDAIVLAKKDSNGNHDLYAFIVADHSLPVSELKKSLANELPGYMVPPYFVIIDKIPLNPNGKVDRMALMKLEVNIKNDKVIEGPMNETEQKMVEIWQYILGFEGVGVCDDFFSLAGNSLKAIRLTLKINKEFGVEISLKDIFEQRTVREIACYIGSLNPGNYIYMVSIGKIEYYPASSAQKRLYLINRFDGNGINYNMPRALTIEGKLDIEQIRKAFSKLIDRHESLRTSFEIIDDELVQRVNEKAELEIDCIETEEGKINEAIKEFLRPFDLSKAPLLRVKVLKISQSKHVLLLDTHHIISDGESSNILIRDLVSFYCNKELPELKIQYKDFTHWQIKMLNSEKVKAQEKYWLDRLAGDIPVLNLPLDYQRPSMQSLEGGKLNFRAARELTGKLKKLAAGTETTLFMVLLAAYNVLLSKYSGQEDIIVGIPVAGREHADLENVTGMFVNTLALRNNPAASLTFKEFLNNVKKNTLSDWDNGDYQFDDLISKLSLKRDLSRNPLFDTMFTFQENNMEEIAIPGLKLTPYEFGSTTTIFDIFIQAMETDGELEFSIWYSVALFRKETMERLAGHFLNILADLTDNAEKAIMEVDMLSKAEREKLLGQFNDTALDCNIDTTVAELFEAQVLKTPDAVAIIYKGESLTYAQLDKKASQVAAYLRNKNVKPDELVGIMVKRSLNMIVAIMGVLKAGAAYLPIDPAYPRERISYMLNDSGANIVLAYGEQSGELGGGLDIIDMADGNLFIETGTVLDVKCNTTVNNLAYVIYTSGSTGNPKGVMLENKSVFNFIHGMRKCIDFKEGKTILALTTICFDIFVLETLLPLTCGMKIIIADEMQQRDPEEMNSLIIDNKVDMLQLTPSRLQLLLNGGKDLNLCDAFNCFSTLEEIMVGGEPFPESLLAELRKLTKAKIYNMYGPTETTVWSTVKDLTESNGINIGKPIANTQIYIVDKYNNAQPIGIPGELCIAGDGLARGYLKRPELTDEKFVPNPFIEGKKMYRTGDVAKWLPGGELDCMGRLDNQVKIRGFRIELGEIEEKLMGHFAVKEAAVVARADENGNKYLCAYYTGAVELTTAKLRESLSKDLPDYMVPSYFVHLKKMPLTPNGKVNRRELPEVSTRPEPGGEYVAPANEIEEKLVEIWSEILGLENIGVEHNLFELGGHSLKAMLIINRINKEFNSDISLGIIFETPTIRGIFRHLTGTAQADAPALKPLEERNYYDLSSAQKRMYVIDNLFEAPTISYNMPAVIILEGSLDRQRLETAFKNLIKRHEALRTSFDFVESKPVQRIHKEVPFNLEYMEGEQSKLEEMISELVKPFDLTKAPLYRAALISHGEGKHTLLIDMHHIISDGTSLGIMHKDLVDLYKGNELSELKVQYKDFSAWQNELIKSQTMKKKEEYWLNVFSGSLPVLDMPTDYPRPEVVSFEGDRYHHMLDKALTSKIYELQAKTRTTLYMVLLAAYSILLSKCSAQEDIVVGTPVLGRQHPDLEKVMGIFVNTLAMRSYPEGVKTFIEFLKEIKVNSLKALENQDYQFEELVQKLGQTGDISRNPVFSTMLTLQNMNFPHIELEGLRFVPYDYSLNISIFDLSLFVWEEKGAIKVIFEYNTKLFKRETVEKLAGYMTRILEQLVSDNYVKIKDICMPDGEKVVCHQQQLNSETDLLLHKGAEKGIDQALVPKSRQEEILLEVWKKVLDLNTIGLMDGFFKLGGDSIKAIQVVADLRKHGYSIQVMHIFMHQTIRAIAACMKVLKPASKQDGMDSDDLFYKGFTPEAFADFVKFLPQHVEEPAEILNIYPVLPSQERMLFFSLFYKNSTAYFNQVIIDLKGTVDIKALEKSLNVVIEKHEVLRTVFFYKKAKQPIQVILKERTATLEYIDIGNYEQEEQRIFIDKLKANDRKKNFNLSKDLLLRLHLLKTGEESYKLLWSHHHIILDGWSFYIVLLDLFKTYCSVIHGKALKQEEAYSYGKYLGWLESRDREEALNYWKEKLKDYSYKPLITNYKNKLYSKEDDNRSIIAILNSELTKKVINAAKMHDVTLNNMFQVLWGLLLQADTGTDDVVYGVVSSGRPPEVYNINKMVGLFVNVIPLRVKCREELTLQQVLRQVNGYMAESEGHSYYSMLALQEKMGLKDKNLIDHVMVFENFPVESGLNQLYKELDSGFVVGNIRHIEQTNYNFNIAVIPGDEIRIIFYYNAFACEEGYIRELESRFIKLLEKAVVNFEVTVGDLIKI